MKPEAQDRAVFYCRLSLRESSERRLPFLAGHEDPCVKMLTTWELWHWTAVLFYTTTAIGTTTSVAFEMFYTPADRDEHRKGDPVPSPEPVDSANTSYSGVRCHRSHEWSSIKAIRWNRPHIVFGVRLWGDR